MTVNDYIEDSLRMIHRGFNEGSLKAFKPVAAKVHLVVKIGDVCFTEDCLLESAALEEALAAKIKSVVHAADRSAGGVAGKIFRMSVELFARNKRGKFYYLADRRCDSSSAFDTRILKKEQLEGFVASFKKAFGEEMIPLIDSKGNFVSEQKSNGV